MYIREWLGGLLGLMCFNLANTSLSSCLKLCGTSYTRGVLVLVYQSYTTVEKFWKWFTNQYKMA